jgi:hypothetical protein
MGRHLSHTPQRRYTITEHTNTGSVDEVQGRIKVVQAGSREKRDVVSLSWLPIRWQRAVTREAPKDPPE